MDAGKEPTQFRIKLTYRIHETNISENIQLLVYPLQSWRWEQCKQMKQDIFVNPNHMWSFAMPKAMFYCINIWYRYVWNMFLWSKSDGSIFEIFRNTSNPISYGLFASINFPVPKRPNQFAQGSPMLPSGQPTVPSHRAVDREALVKGNQFWRNFEAPVCNKLFPFVLLVWRKMYCTKTMLELTTSKCVFVNVYVYQEGYSKHQAKISTGMLTPKWLKLKTNMPVEWM